MTANMCLTFLSHREMKNEWGEAGLLPSEERDGASSSQKAWEGRGTSLGTREAEENQRGLRDKGGQWSEVTPGGKIVQKRGEVYLDQNSKSKNENQIQAPSQVFRRLHGVPSKIFLSLMELAFEPTCMGSSQSYNIRITDNPLKITIKNHKSWKKN